MIHSCAACGYSPVGNDAFSCPNCHSTNHHQAARDGQTAMAIGVGILLVISIVIGIIYSTILKPFLNQHKYGSFSYSIGEDEENAACRSGLNEISAGFHPRYSFDYCHSRWNFGRLDKDTQDLFLNTIVMPRMEFEWQKLPYRSTFDEIYYSGNFK